MGNWSLNIVGGYELPIGNVNMLVGFEGNPSNGSFVGGGSYGYVGGVASVNATTGDWGVAGGLSIPAILPTGTGVIPFVGMGADQNGYYFVASGTLVFTKGTDPTFPDGVATGINVTYATQLGSWDDVRDALNQMGIDIVDYFDELFGSPEDPFPASNAITAMAQALAEFFPTPIVLDLNNDNIEYIPNTANSGVFFDIDADGFAEKTEWIKPDDGFLVRDTNSNGVIDSQAELFGDNAGTTAYAKLAALNTNNTGASANAITSADTAWNTLKVWQDLNSNGKTEAGELKTLATLGITSIGLQTYSASLPYGTLLNGHPVAAGSTFIRNGVTQQAADVLFDVDQENSWYLGGANQISAEALFQTLSRGYGTVKSLHFALSENATLMTQVKALDALPTTSLEQFYAKLEAVVTQWAGATHVSPIALGADINAQHLAVVEAFGGRTVGTINNAVVAGWSVESGYTSLMQEMMTRFITQGSLATVMGNPYYDFTHDKMVFSLTHTQILANAVANVPVDAIDKITYWSEISRALQLYATDFGMTATAMKGAVDMAAGYVVALGAVGGVNLVGGIGNDTLSGGVGNDTITGNAGADSLIGNAGNDFIYGGDGNDAIYGSDGNNILYGDAGNDSIYGGTGASSIYGGSGADSILGGNGNETIFGGTENDTISGGLGNDLIYGGDGNDSITDQSGNNTIYGDAGNDSIYGGSENSSFFGGIGLDYISGGGGSETISGGDGNDALYSGGGNDSITGDAGNDSLYGGAGVSTLVGGLGADRFTGGTGAETFRYAKGDGDDVIVKASTATTGDVLVLTNIARTGVTFSAVSDFSPSSDPNSVKINITGGGSVLLAKHLDGSGAGRIANVTFSDGTIMTAAQIAQAAALLGTMGADTIVGTIGNDVMLGVDGADSLSGGLGNDTIYGQKGADIVRGGAGADLLNGGDDSDTYRYAKGDGDDNLAEFGYTSTQDTLILENITRSEVSFLAVDRNTDGTADSVKIMINGGGSVLLQDQIFLSVYYTVDSVQFSDGITMTAAQINAALSPAAQNGTSGDDTLFGDSGNNIINGLGGNDQLIGDAGDDLLNGDAGNDFIWGELGNDSINGGDGLDTLQGGDGADTIDGGLGNDNVFGELGNDTVTGGDGNDDVQGNEGNDIVTGGNGTDTLWGQDGDDVLNGGAGKDQMTGGLGVDTFTFSAIADSQVATADYIWDFNPTGEKIDVQGLGFTGLDTDGGLTEAGELRFSVAGSVTTVTSDQTGFTFQMNGALNSTNFTNSDFIFGSPPPSGSTIAGTASNDNLSGTAGNDIVNGLGGNDVLNGAAGNDTIDGGLGRDTATGGAGNDVFLFTNNTHSTRTGTGSDLIADFVDGQDRVSVVGLGYTGFDTDGGQTEAGELRKFYTASTNVTSITSDQTGFAFNLTGNLLTTLDNSDMLF